MPIALLGDVIAEVDEKSMAFRDVSALHESKIVVIMSPAYKNTPTLLMIVNLPTET